MELYQLQEPVIDGEPHQVGPAALAELGHDARSTYRSPRYAARMARIKAVRGLRHYLDVTLFLEQSSHAASEDGVVINQSMARRRFNTILIGIFAVTGLILVAAGIVSLVAVGLLGSLVPARRATRVDPVMALREE